MKSTLILSFWLALALTASAQCPQFVQCSAQPDTFCASLNDPLLWNSTGFYDSLHQQSDLYEADAALRIRLRSDCGLADSIRVRYVLLLDLDQDGLAETAVDSDQLPGDHLVRMGNASQPNFSGGVAMPFDDRNVLPQMKFAFALQRSSGSDTLTARVRWVTAQQPGQYYTPKLPGGFHRVLWIAQVPGGQPDTCVQEFRVRDCAPPTVLCKSGLSVNLSVGSKQFTLWGSDLLQYVEDGISPLFRLELGLRRKGQGTGFPLQPSGQPSISISFTCNDINQTHEVELWARDPSGNASFCIAQIIISDNAGACGDPFMLQVCAKYQCNNIPVLDVNYQITSSTAGIPIIIELTNGSDDCLIWPTTIPVEHVDIKPYLNTNWLNGVSTYDLVLISRHILGLEPLPTPYHMIAADANKSGSITTYDIVELRKLILGIYTSMPNNESWRFISKSFVFPDPQNPFKTAFPENTVITWLPSSIEFVAIKVGDVNCSSSPFAPNSEDRSPDLLFSMPDLSLDAGEWAELTLQPTEAGTWAGLQAAFRFDPELLEVEGLYSTSLPDFSAEHWYMPQPGQLRLSWSAAQAQPVPAAADWLTLRLRAKQPLRLSEAWYLDEAALPAEAYTATAARRALHLAFRQMSSPGEAASIGTPQPNPSTTGSHLWVHLPAAQTVLLRVCDLNGQQVHRFSADLEAGTHRLDLPATIFPQTGLYTWHVEAGEATRTGKVLVAE